MTKQEDWYKYENAWENDQDSVWTRIYSNWPLSDNVGEDDALYDLTKMLFLLTRFG